MQLHLNCNSLGNFNKAFKAPEISITYLKARAGLRGISVLSHSKGYIVASGMYSKDFDKLEEVITFVQKMGVSI